MNREMSAALYAASHVAPPAPPPRQVRLDLQVMRHTDHSRDEAKASDMVPARIAELLHARHVSQDSQASPKKASGSVSDDMDLFTLQDDVSVTESAQSSPRTTNTAPQTIRSHIGTTPPKRHVRVTGIGRAPPQLHRRVTRDLENMYPEKQMASHTMRNPISKGSGNEHESVELQAALRERDLANQSVKSLTAEVVRLAGQLKLRTKSESLKSTRVQSHSQSQRPSGTKMQSGASEGQHILKHIGKHLRGRHVNRFSLAVLQAWDRYVMQKKNLEHALAACAGKQAASVLDAWRQSTNERGKGNETLGSKLQEGTSIYGRPFIKAVSGSAADGDACNDPQLYGIPQPDQHSDSAREASRRRSKSRERLSSYDLANAFTDVQELLDDNTFIQRIDLVHHLRQIALRQMNARWSRRRLVLHFHMFVGKCKHVRIRRRNFLAVSARNICILLRKCIRMMWRNRLRSSKKQRAIEASDFRILQHVKVIVVAWRGCTSFPSSCLIFDHLQISNDRGLTSSVKKLSSTLSNLDSDRIALLQRLNLLEEELSHQARTSENPKQDRILSPHRQPHYETVGVSPRALAGTFDMEAEYTPAHLQGEQADLEEVYQTFESTIRAQASDLKKIQESWLQATMIKNVMRSGLTDMIKMLREVQLGVHIQRNFLAAEAESRPKEQCETSTTLNASESTLQLAPGFCPNFEMLSVSNLKPSPIGPFKDAGCSKIASLLNETQERAVAAEFPGDTVRLIQEHMDELYKAAVAIRKKDIGATEESLRRLQVNAKLLHIEASQQASPTNGPRAWLEASESQSAPAQSTHTSSLPAPTPVENWSGMHYWI